MKQSDTVYDIAPVEITVILLNKKSTFKDVLRERRKLQISVSFN